MKIIPLADRVVIKTVEGRGDHQERHHPHRQRQGKAQVAEVVAVGPGGTVDGKEVVMTVKVATRSSPASIPAPRSRWTAKSAPSLRQGDILAIVEE